MPAQDQFRATAIKRAMVADFRGRPLPAPACLVGYSALIQAFDLRVPLHHVMAAASLKSVRVRNGGWAIYPATSYPGATVVST